MIYCFNSRFLLTSLNKSGKRLIADKFYKSEREKISCVTEHNHPDTKKFKKRALARQETVNMRIKQFKIIEDRFCHGNQNDHLFHKACFEACCILVQYKIEGNNPLFTV